ncbi:MAG: nucleotidyltransferase family protein [Planctomycetia bacterium]|nr:nucleotidyltransferase family protein [Planctomycetia bacterium]
MFDFFRNPQSCRSYDIAQWERLFGQARAGRLLGKLAYLLEDENLLDVVPPESRWLLESARVKSERGRRQILWEIDRICHVLREFQRFDASAASVPVVLLKGAAYHVANLPWSRGRISVDVDIMVPQAQLGTVETALMLGGWFISKESAYDDHFYRDWMHEIPPMRNAQRDVALDVHHTILPRTGKLTVDAALLFECATPLPGENNLFTLEPCDMLLHSAVHTFQDGELWDCARDFLDLNDMFRYFGRRDADFFDKLLRRNETLRLNRPLYYAVHFCDKLLGTPFPPDFLREVRKFGGVLSNAIMDAVVPTCALPHVPGSETPTQRVGKLGLYIRSHALRMPMRILIPHLWAKYRKRRKEKREKMQNQAKEE